MWKGTNENRLTVLVLKLCEYTCDLKYQQGKKMFASGALSRLHIGTVEDVHDIIPPKSEYITYFSQLQTSYTEYMHTQRKHHTM